MKINILIYTISILLITVLNSFSQNTYVPDDNFEKALIELGYDSWPLNDLIPTANISSIKELLISGKYIENLTGIEDFTQLEILDCSNNYLQIINISSNLALKELSCENTWISVLDIQSNNKLRSLNCNSNRLTALDVKSNPTLTKINCAMNLLTSIDLSHCKELENLDCSSNDLTSLDFQQNNQLTNLNCKQNQLSSLNTSLNPKIETLNCQFNQLKNLDPTNNVKLIYLNCAYNQISSLNISQNTFLKVFNCAYNSLTELNISNNHEINTLHCASNRIKTLDLSSNPDLNRLSCANNQLTKLDLRNGNNEKMGEEFSGIMNATGNPTLFSIEVDNMYVAATYSSWLKGSWTHYSSPGVEFSNQKTFIPDNNFEQALIGLGFDSGELNDSVLTEAIKHIKTLLIDYKNIADLTGIKDFISIERLNCNSNQLSALDLSSIKKLKLLYCEFNELVDLDLSSNTELAELSCATNKLTGLNLQNGNNNNMNLNARENPDLLCIQVDDEDASYKFDNWYKDIFTAYATDCSGYKIKMTYVPDDNFEQALIDLGLDSETTLNDSVPTVAIKNLKSLDIRYKNIKNLTGIEDFTLLEFLSCSGNQLIEIILGNNLNLTQVMCNDNQLSHLDLTDNKTLRYLNASNNKLTGIDLRNGNNESLTNLDLTSNENLFCIQVDDPLAANEYYYWWKSGYATYSEDCSNYVLEMTYVPDDNFEQDLINQNFDFGPLNDSVPSAAIRALKYLNIQAREIHDLTGIEDFKALETLICSNNFLTTFDLSSNINLKNLQCGNFFMEHLDIKSNTLLESLNCAGSSLTTIDLSSNPVLHTLNCASNKLQNLDLLANPLLKNLSCGDNYLQDLDLTSNKLIEGINCTGNLLSNINIQNGNNQNILNFTSYGNQPACILVDNIDSAYAYPNWQKDSYSEYSFDCSNLKIEMTYMPDDNFEQYFVDRKYDVILNDSVPTEIIISFGELGIGNRNITDLTGIQDFTSLSRFSCEQNQITSLDLSNNTKIEYLYCNNNQLTSLNIGSNNVLNDFNFNNNYLTNIDLSECKNLLWLSCENNKLTSLDLSNNKALAELWAKNNALESLNVKNGNNLKLRIDARNNPDLKCIQVDDDNNAPNYFFWYKDNGASYSENCALQARSYIPDDNFEQGLINLKYDEGTLDNYIISSQIAGITSLNLSGKNIQDMKGLEDFFALKTLDLSNNNLSFLELERILGLGNFRNFSSDFIYWPQVNFGEDIDTTVNINESITLDFPEYTAATRDFFRWKKNGTFLEKPDQQQLLIEQATLADNGSYVLTVRNTFFPKLTLESKIINLKVLKPLKSDAISLFNIKIYPNPANAKIFIDLQNQTVDFKIFNIAGIIVFEEKDFNKNWLDLTNFLPGVYVFSFEIANTGVINRKVIIK